MKKSLDKISEMITDDTMKSTFGKIVKAKNTEELIKLAAEDGVNLSKEDAEKILRARRSRKELKEDVLDEISKACEK